MLCAHDEFMTYDEPKPREKERDRGKEREKGQTHKHIRSHIQKIGNKFAGFLVSIYTQFVTKCVLLIWCCCCCCYVHISDLLFTLRWLHRVSFCEHIGISWAIEMNKSSANRPATVNACIISADHHYAAKRCTPSVASHAAQQDIDCNETFRYLKLPIVRFMLGCYFFTVQPKFRSLTNSCSPFFCFSLDCLLASVFFPAILWVFHFVIRLLGKCT